MSKQHKVHTNRALACLEGFKPCLKFHQKATLHLWDYGWQTKKGHQGSGFILPICNVVYMYSYLSYVTILERLLDFENERDFVC